MNTEIGYIFIGDDKYENYYRERGDEFYSNISIAKEIVKNISLISEFNFFYIWPSYVNWDNVNWERTQQGHIKLSTINGVLFDLNSKNYQIELGYIKDIFGKNIIYNSDPIIRLKIIF